MNRIKNRSDGAPAFRALVLLLALLLALSLAACTKSAEPVSPAGPAGGEEPIPAAPSDEDVLKAFLEGTVTATARTNFSGADEWTPGTACSVREFGEAVGSYVEAELGGYEAFDVSYAYIDCGNDGVPELALRYDYHKGELWGDVTETFAVKVLDGAPVILDGFESFYRVTGEINACGAVTRGGSSGAMYYDTDHWLYDADGNRVFLYSESLTFGQSEPFISPFKIPDELLPDGYPEDSWEYSEGTSYTTVAYNFNEYFYDEENYAKQYNRYLRENFFTFLDDQGNYAAPSEAYKTLYTKLGLPCYDAETAEKLVADHCSALGATAAILNAPAVSWTEWDE